MGRDVGLWGWGNDGGGEGGGEGGWGEAFIEVLNKTGIVTRLGCRNERYDTKSPCNDITFSKIRHNLAQKSPKTRRREISPHYLCKKEPPSWKTGSLRIFKLKYFSIRP